jgi:hypothetical protein
MLRGSKHLITFIATASPITYLGAKPVFIDSDRSSWNMNPDLLSETLKVIFPAGDRLLGKAAVIKRAVKVGLTRAQKHLLVSKSYKPTSAALVETVKSSKLAFTSRSGHQLLPEPP